MKAYMANYDFRILINNGQFGFSRVSNLQAELEMETIQEGGFGPRFLPKTKTKLDTLILERGVLLKGGTTIKLDVGRRLFGVVIAVGKKGNEDHMYTFDSGIVTKMELSGLDAAGHDILIEKLEITHSGLYKVVKGGS